MIRPMDRIFLRLYVDLQILLDDRAVILYLPVGIFRRRYRGW
jgi:hypothetical protein